MRTQAASHSTHRHTAGAYTYNAVDTIEDIAATIQSIKSANQSNTSSAAQLALVSITLHFEEEEQFHFQERANQSTHYLLDNLRPLVRKTDVVLLLNHSFYFLLLGANMEGGAIVQERLWEALLWRVHNAPDGDILRPHSMEIGHSAYPLPQEQALECIMAAREPHQHFSFSPEESAPKNTTRKSKRSQHVIHEQAPSSDFVSLPLLARQAGIPYLSLLPRKFPIKLRQLISPQLALELRCFPLGRERDTLTVAIANPQDSQVLDRLRQETGLRIFPVLAPQQELQIALEELV